MALTPWLSEVVANFCQKPTLVSFLSYSSNSSRCSLVCFTSALASFFLSALNLRYFSTSFDTISKSMDEIFPFCVALKLNRQCNLTCFELELNCIVFFLFYGKFFKGFSVIAAAREKIRLVPLNTIPTDRTY